MPIIQQKYKIDRRCGVNISGREKSAFNTRPSRPGQHGKNMRRKVSEMGKRLLEKQKLRFYYGLSELQFRSLFRKSAKGVGERGLKFVRLLETRLDSVVFRLKWAPTIYAAKQLISHGHVKINDTRVKSASHAVHPGDIVSLSDTMKNNGVVNITMESSERDIPSYIDASSGQLLKLPDSIDEVLYPNYMNLQMIIEWYSRLI